MKSNKITLVMVLLISTVVGFSITSCQKMDHPLLPKDTPLTEDWNLILTKDPALKMYLSFENSMYDSITNETPAKTAKFSDGINGKAFQGGAGSNFIVYDSAKWISSVINFTISFWIKTNERIAGPGEAVFGIPNSSWLGGDCVFFEGWDWPPSGELVARGVFNSTGIWYLYGENPGPGVNNGRWQVPPNTWTHIALTYNSSSKAFEYYLNGVKQSTQTAAALKLPATSQFVLGANNLSGDRFIQGALDQFRFYDRILSIGEIQKIYTLKI